MKIRRTSLLVLGAAGLLVVVALWLFQTSPAAESRREVEAKRAAATDAGPTALPPTVTVDSVVARAEPARSIVDVSGELEAVRRSVIGAEVGGRVIEIAVDDHQQVDAGQVLVRLDTDLARAAVARARAALASAEARRSLADAELARRQELSQKGVASAAELDRAESEAQTGEAAVAEARAALLDAETRLAKMNIRAPFAGTVGEIDLEPGAYVGPGAPVTTLVDISAVELVVGVSDEEILALRPGDEARIEVDVFPGREFVGTVQRPGRAPDETTRKYPVPVRLPNPDGALLPGMLGKVRFTLGDGHLALRVPRRAVLREFDLEYLFVLEPTDERATATARRRRVRTIPVPFHPELLEVVEGLEAEEAVATTGARDLRDGLAVRTRPAHGGRGVASPPAPEIARDREAS